MSVFPYSSTSCSRACSPGSLFKSDPPSTLSLKILVWMKKRDTTVAQSTLSKLCWLNLTTNSKEVKTNQVIALYPPGAGHEQQQQNSDRVRLGTVAENILITLLKSSAQTPNPFPSPLSFLSNN